VSGVRHLYVHLPFCARRCGYCAFVVEVGALDRRDAYLEAVRAELDREWERLGSLDTVYVGGGTPTLMGAERIGRILDRVRDRLTPDAEVTVEANPETVDAAEFAALRRVGVTRVSVGAQSFQPALLSALDRAATPDQVRTAMEGARAAGFASVSIDLLFGVPGQGWPELEADLDVALGLAPDHISWYELEVKPGSTLAREGTTVDEDFTEEAYRVIVDRLEAAGYRWYETANFARPGHECRHSLAYWSAADYLGIGIGAVSTVAERRWRNAPHLDRYITACAAGRPPRRTTEELDADTRRRERWMLALRLDQPLSRTWAGPPDHPEALEELAEIGLVRWDDDAIRLTREGRFVQNAVVAKLMDFPAVGRVGAGTRPD
jgi:oxygen-independent coproporphyrinogen-3 oxidase